MARKQGVGLAISGGGFRATLYHLGSLWRLNELGYLKHIKRISSVSGGSILAAYLGLKWKDLKFENDTATNFEGIIAAPIEEFCARNIDESSIFWAIVSFFTTGDMLTRNYARYLYGNATLQDLASDGPEFVIYATNLQTGASFQLTRDRLFDYQIGQLEQFPMPLAKAVACSSAFPPVFGPIAIKTNPAHWIKPEGWDPAYFGYPELKRKILVTDGGIYDNLGLEAIWDTYETVLVSDAGKPLGVLTGKESQGFNDLTEMNRVFRITANQVGALRKRKLIEDLAAKKNKGTYWGIGSDINNYQLPDAMVKDNEITRGLKMVRTRLNRFSPEEQGRLINWGYALTDTAMRRWVLDQPHPPGKWPKPAFALG